MSLNYECCYCHSVFPAESRVDGYAQGYRVGFLCPHCGNNIKDGLLFADQRLDDCQTRWTKRSYWLLVPTFVTTFFDTTFVIGGHEISLSAIAGVALVCTAGLVLLFVPCTRRPGVIVTQPVNRAQAP